MSADDELAREIREHIARVEPGTFVDALGYATALGQRYEQRSVEEIERLIIDQLRVRGLWSTN